MLGWVSVMFLCSTGVLAQETVIPSSVREAATTIKARQLQADVEYLAADGLRGRGTPSPGLDSATAFVVRRLHELRLRPAGDSGTFLQRYRVHRQVLDTADTFVEIAGRRITFGADMLVQFFGDSTPITAPLVYVGHGVRMPRRNIDPFAGLDVRGKIVIAHDLASLPPQLRASPGIMNVDWFRVWDSARELGAIGLILVSTAMDARGWEALRGVSQLRTVEELVPAIPSAYARVTLPTVLVSRTRIGDLFAGENIDAATLLARATVGDPLPSFQLSTMATLHLGVAHTEVFSPSNVVAMVEGSDPQLRHEAVVLMSHLDGVAQGPPSATGDTVYNAADDNASGSAGLLGITAALMRGPRPKRSVILVWDTGEEKGLWGSRFLAANPVVPLRDVVAFYNVDMIGRSSQPGTHVRGEEELTGPDEIYVTGPRVLSSDADSLFVQANRGLHNLTLNRGYDVATHARFYPRSDGAPLLERGVLVIKIQDGDHPDYHRPGDESSKLDVRKMERVAQTLFVTAWLFADAPLRPRMDKPMPPHVMRPR